MGKKALGLLLVVAMVSAAAAAGEAKDDPSETWLSVGEKLIAAGDAGETAAAGEAPAGDGPPLPLHTIEGVGGALTVPMAYLVNPGPPGTKIGMPSVSATYLNMGKKSIQSFAVSQTFCRRFELSYAINRFDLGSFPRAVRKVTGGALRVRRQEVNLHHFNARVLVIEENSFDLPLPAVVVGMQVKVNGGLRGMDDSTNGTITGLGFDRSNGIDFTLHASKMFPTLAFGRPLILTAGVRNSQASNIGYTGFGDSCDTTVEADVACLVLDNLAVGYEFRQKNNPYDVADGILGDEDDWHAIRAAYIINANCTIAAAWGYMGPVGNTFGNCAWGVQFKYEF